MRIFLSLLVVVASAALADAGPLRRGRAAPVVVSSCSSGSCPVSSPGYPYQFVSASSQPPVCADGSCPAALPAVILGEPPLAAVTGDDALGEVNALRAARGLRPYIRDEGLTQAARACAAHRAAHRLFGHVVSGGGDFQFLPPGVRADAAGCAAYPPQYGFLACCVYESYQYAGAATVIGPDGRAYHHLFVRR